MEHTLSLAPQACLARQAESRLTLIGKLKHSGPRGVRFKVRAGREKVGRGQQDKTPPGCRPWGLWEAGLSQARPLGPETEERFQLPLPRQPAGFLRTPRSFAGIETFP